MSYYRIRDKQLFQDSHPPAGTRPFAEATGSLLPPMISALHGAFATWGQAGYSPGGVIPARIWIDADGRLAFYFAPGTAPKRLMQVGLARELAAWLVLLDKWMETFVVIARARSIWNVQELGGALAFLSPAFLPRVLIAQPPDNWARVAHALAIAVADGELRGRSY